MRKDQVRSIEEAFAYILDCNLATVESMAALKSRKKIEYIRQIQIAQTALDWAKEMKVDVSSTRADDIITYHLSLVEKWATTIQEKYTL